MVSYFSTVVLLVAPPPVAPAPAPSAVVAAIFSANSANTSLNFGHDFSGMVMAFRKLVFTYEILEV